MNTIQRGFVPEWMDWLIEKIVFECTKNIIHHN